MILEEVSMIGIFLAAFIAAAPEPIEMAPCVHFKGYSFLANGNLGLAFENGCGTGMQIAVCVTDYFGKKRLYESKDYVTRGGIFTVYLDNNQQPRKYSYTFALTKPEPPKDCGQNRV